MSIQSTRIFDPGVTDAVVKTNRDMGLHGNGHVTNDVMELYDVIVVSQISLLCAKQHDQLVLFYM